MHIGIVFDVRKQPQAHEPADFYAEFDAPSTLEAIEAALRSLGYRLERIGNLVALTQALAQGRRWDLVFNLAEGLYGRSREAQVPALLEAYNVPYSGSDALTLALSLHKGLTKTLWQAAGLATAPFMVAETLEQLVSKAASLPPFPLFVKPVHEGSSKGIDDAALIHTPAALQDQCAYLLDTYRQPVLIERFLPGKEYSVGILGNGLQSHVLGVLEMVSHNPQGIMTFAEKEGHRDDAPFYRPLEDAQLEQQLAALALAAYRQLECRDFGRVDLRLDEAGQAQLLEINPLPNLDPQHSSLSVMARARGLSYPQLLGIIVVEACQRYGRSCDVPC